MGAVRHFILDRKWFSQFLDSADSERTTASNCHQKQYSWTILGWVTDYWAYFPTSVLEGCIMARNFRNSVVWARVKFVETAKVKDGTPSMALDFRCCFVSKLLLLIVDCVENYLCKMPHYPYQIQPTMQHQYVLAAHFFQGGGDL